MRKINNVLLFASLAVCGGTMPVAAAPLLQSVKAQTPTGRHTMSLKVIDKDAKESVVMATCVLEPLGATTVTNADGQAIIPNIPSGTYRIKVSYVGYQEYVTDVKVEKDLNLNIALTPTSLKLREVVVTARRNASGTSTSSIIDRQAIDHLQASSLADVMQLVPGQIIRNTDLTSQSGFQTRFAGDNYINNTATFGTSVVVDGVPMSNNGAVTQGNFNATAFNGTDLRRVAADDVDQVEVVRGIPSAEYGDLTSGLVVVRSRVGVTPWQVKGKITPEMQNYSLGKGFRTNGAGVVNFSFDYAKAWGDPRYKTRSYGRYTGSLGWGYDISKTWHVDTKLRLTAGRQWSGQDPDALQDGTERKDINVNMGLSHNGRISVNKLFMRTLSYTLGLNYSWINNTNTAYIGSANTAILTAMETGYYNVPWMYGSYLATGRTESRPGNVFIKVNDAFSLKAGKTRQNFKVGVDYRYDWNSGKGYFNLDDSKPYSPNANGRPRAFNDVPGLHILSAYAEDNFALHFNKVNTWRAQFGLRFSTSQPFSDVSTTALSPRFNTSFSATKWLTLRAGVGLSSKAPGLSYLYPDKKYYDRMAASYMPQTDPAAQLLTYHTQVYDVKKSKGLKNATTTKVEAGVDIKLPWGGNVNVLGYFEKTPNGFGNATDYFTYTANFYDQTSGLNITPGSATTINYGSPARTDFLFASTGKIGNVNSVWNRGIEFDINFGEVKPLHTKVLFSGAYSQTKMKNTNLNTSSVRSALLPARYVAYGTTPFLVIYPSGEDIDERRSFISTIRLVTAVPRLRMVASFNAQAILQQWSQSFVSNKQAIGWITQDLQQHTITPDMQGGYISYNGTYSATQPTADYIAISDLSTTVRNNGFTKMPVTWNLSARLTKELGNIGSFSLYVNNAIYYEPYLTSNMSSSLVQRNTGNFSYGVELSFKL